MKKVTLSAAILAVAMMGCSDMGVDNSVASTNEVKSEQPGNFLAKLTPEPISSGEVGLEHSGYKRYVYPEDGIAVRVHSRPDDYTWKSRGRATIWVESSVAADVATVVSVAVAGCSMGNNGDVTCTHHRANWDSKAATRGFDVYTAELPVPYGQVGVMAAYGAVWNLGKPSQNEFNSVTYGGALPDNMAYSVYQKYILQAVYNINHGRPIDEMP
ncbi:MAG: hypothetical protein IJM92_17510 [Fibrobacter sp.]|uniref:hypothetical protein n=1 Tax=Fibrobacter sp. TaxID=35828 RepID=UPI0025BB16DA|nr:hypothetical protein [Fibrobacter sp.]MBQ7081416.1 hypothetical protein [Fibrobacter sp.]